jgi:hypothetical protein
VQLLHAAHSRGNEVAWLRAERGLLICGAMRAVATIVWALVGWPWAAFKSARARRRLHNSRYSRGPLTLERVA